MTSPPSPRNEVGAVTFQVDGQSLTVATGTLLASALMSHCRQGFRRSLEGALRAPLCGMGICFECRLIVDGSTRLACQTQCREGMQVVTEVATERMTP